MSYFCQAGSWKQDKIEFWCSILPESSHLEDWAG